MNTNIERLNKIRAKCVELLEIANKRTPGEWKWDGSDLWHQGTGYEGQDPHIYTGITKDERLAKSVSFQANAIFIVSCAGPAEAGWRATIAAIDTCISNDPVYQDIFDLAYKKQIAGILTAWEGVEL